MAFAFRTAASDETRRLLMLQNASFLTMFRDALAGRGAVKDLTVDDVASAAGTEAELDSIFQSIGGRGNTASEYTLAWLKRRGSARELIDAARVLVYLKSNDAHDYKFSSAVLEDYDHVSPQWRDLYLATNVNLLQSSNRGNSGLVQRTPRRVRITDASRSTDRSDAGSSLSKQTSAVSRVPLSSLPASANVLPLSWQIRSLTRQGRFHRPSFCEQEKTKLGTPRKSSFVTSVPFCSNFFQSAMSRIAPLCLRDSVFQFLLMQHQPDSVSLEIVVVPFQQYRDVQSKSCLGCHCAACPPVQTSYRSPGKCRSLNH